jgi:hypothetical protein
MEDTGAFDELPARGGEFCLARGMGLKRRDTSSSWNRASGHEVVSWVSSRSRLFDTGAACMFRIGISPKDASSWRMSLHWKVSTFAKHIWVIRIRQSARVVPAVIKIRWCSNGKSLETHTLSQTSAGIRDIYQRPKQARV